MSRLLISRCRLAVFVAFFGWSGCLAAQPAVSGPRVLILNSYHAGYSWSDGELNGLLRVLMRENPRLIPSVEFLDAKRTSTPEQIEALLPFIRRKYRDTPFDLIITFDDAALAFALAHRADFGAGVSIVFGGVNNYQPEKFTDVPRITGVSEAFDFVGNLELIMQMRPEAHTVHLICDSAEASNETLAAFNRVAPQFSRRLHFEQVAGWTADDLLQRMASLPAGDAALVIGNARDAAGRIISEDTEFIHALSKRSAVPIIMIAQPALPLAYGFGWERALWFGVGGRMLSSDRHGEAVGEIACRVLRGEACSSIPVVRTSPTRLAFDYQQLLRHHIDLARLPVGAEIFNRPQTFFELYRNLIFATVGVIVLLTSTIVVLLINYIRRQRAERALRRSNERFELIAQATQDSVWDLDTGSGVLTGNDVFTRLLGLEAGVPATLAVFLRMIHGEDRDAFEVLLVSPPVELATVSRELRVLSADGTTRFVFLRACFRRDEGGRVIQVLGSMLDLTNLKLAESRLQLLITAVEQATDLIALYELDGVVYYANPSFLRVMQWLQLTAGTVGGQVWQDEEGARIPFSVVAATATAHGRWQQRIVVSSEDGHGRLIQVIVTPILSASGQPPRFLLIGQDVTQEARLEERVRLAQKMDAIGTLASGIAHDFNNILTAITCNVELALGEVAAGHPAAELLDGVRVASERAARLVRQILTFSRQAAPRREELFITPVIAEMLKFLRATVPATVALRHTVIASPMIDGDQTQLYQIVLNLCTNAAHAIGAKSGMIEVLEEEVDVGDDLIAAHPDLSHGLYLRVSIRDDGCGMSPEVMRRIFEPFFTTKSLGQGTGLGLSVVHGILKSHKAAITVYSRPDNGTIFRLYFPAKRVSAGGSLAAEASIAVPRGAGQRIVLVDDEVAITQVAERLLRALGYEVVAFNRSDEACAYLQREGGDLLISDFSMPGFGAFELIRRVRAFAPTMPVIVISGFLSENDRAEAGRIVSLQIVDKPLTTAVLGKAIARVFSVSGNCD